MSLVEKILRSLEAFKLWHTINNFGVGISQLNQGLTDIHSEEMNSQRKDERNYGKHFVQCAQDSAKSPR